MNPILSFYIYGKRYNTIDGDNTYICFVRRENFKQNDAFNIQKIDIDRCACHFVRVSILIYLCISSSNT